MAIFSSFNRKPVFALTAQLCLLGAVCGSLYALIFFGFGKTLLLMAAISGALIVFFYCLLELILFAGDFRKESLTMQFGLRVLGYSILFLLAFCLLSFLHASFTYHTSGDPVQIILAEDYFPFWPNYLLYAFLAAIVFQCIWLLNTVNKLNWKLHFIKDDEIKKVQATIVVLTIKSSGNKEFASEEKVGVYNKILEKIDEEYNEQYLSIYEQDKLKICFLKEFTASQLVHLQQFIYTYFETHISNPEKMLSLQMGFASGEIHLQKCGAQIIFYGEPIITADAQLKSYSSVSTSQHTQIQTPLSILL